MNQPETSPYPQACARCWEKLNGDKDVDVWRNAIIEPGQSFYRTDHGILCESCHQSDIPVNHPAYKKP